MKKNQEFLTNPFDFSCPTFSRQSHHLGASRGRRVEISPLVVKFGEKIAGMLKKIWINYLSNMT